jgi:hypothetical protein
MATGGQISCPPAGNFLSVSGQFPLSADSRPLMWSAVRREVNAVNGTSAISASLIRRCSASSQTALG